MFCFNKPILGLKEAISTTFQEAGVEDWKEKLVAFGADGASVNLGKKAGVAALLKKDIPYLVVVRQSTNKNSLNVCNKSILYFSKKA